MRFDIMYGELPHGRYMFIRQHSRFFDDSGGRYFNYEYMMFEFVIRDSTPVYLPAFASKRAIASAIVSGIIVRAGFIVAAVLLWRFLKRIRKSVAKKRVASSLPAS